MKLFATAAGTAEGRRPGFFPAVLAVMAMGLAAAAPAQAAGGVSGAEKLRRLDIMLMVTGLRCRTGVDNFTADYGRFTSSHLRELNDANAELKSDLLRFHGEVGAQRALDRLSTTMANGYGQGHPWLSCRDLKLVAQNLADVRGRETLEEAADQLLSTTNTARFAWAQR